MAIAISNEHRAGQFKLADFEAKQANTILGWVTSPQLLRWVAPSTSAPLTIEKIIQWKKPRGEAYVLLGPDDQPSGETIPLGYGELNPMRYEPDHLWLGHIIVSPEARGCGLGKLLVQKLLEQSITRHRATIISLIVFPENIDAIACYKSVGFRLLREESHRFGQGPLHRLLRLQMNLK